MQYEAEGLGICLAADYIFYRSVPLLFLMIPVGVCYPLYKKEKLKKRRLKTLAVQFKEAILILSSFLSAGYSLENGVAKSAKELGELYGEQAMITQEFLRLSAGIKMNRQAESLLAQFGERSGLSDIRNFAQVFSAAKKSGGEMVEIIHQTAGVIRDKMQVQEEIDTLVASRVFEQKIMNLIPAGIVLYINIASPGFFRFLYETLTGRLVMTVCMALYIGAILLAEHILNIEI